MDQDRGAQQEHALDTGGAGRGKGRELGVVDKESDLDLLCVVPKHVTRADFFNTLFDLLRKKVKLKDYTKGSLQKK